MARILIIDDNPAVRAAIEQALKTAGHKALLAASGQEGVTVCRSTVPELAMVDIFMPDQDGFQTIGVFSHQFPKVPIIAMSRGHLTSDSMLSVAQHLGVERILGKPLGVKTLLELIEEVLGARERQPDSR